MEGAEDGDAEKTEPEVDPKTKAIQGWLLCLSGLEQGDQMANDNPLLYCDDRHQDQLHSTGASRHAL